MASSSGFNVHGALVSPYPSRTATPQSAPDQRLHAEANIGQLSLKIIQTGLELERDRVSGLANMTWNG